jgi:hypothetical protein
MNHSSNSRITHRIRTIPNHIFVSKNCKPRTRHLYNPAKRILLSHSYEILSDSDRRAAYDRYGPEGLASTSDFGHNDQFGADLFANLFTDPAFGFPFAAGKKDDEIELEVTLEDLYLGKTIKMTLEREVYCRTCAGCASRVHYLSTFYVYSAELVPNPEASRINASSARAEAGSTPHS